MAEFIGYWFALITLYSLLLSPALFWGYPFVAFLVSTGIPVSEDREKFKDFFFDNYYDSRTGENCVKVVNYKTGINVQTWYLSPITLFIFGAMLAVIATTIDDEVVTVGDVATSLSPLFFGIIVGLLLLTIFRMTVRFIYYKVKAYYGN